MHKYASPSPDSRELVAELEFVWDQVKSNVPSSSSSSPLQTLSQMGLHMPPNYPQLGTGKGKARADVAMDDDGPLQVKSPMSQSEEDLEEEEAEIDHEEFVDAPDSQYNPTSEDAGVQTDLAPQPPLPSKSNVLTPKPASPSPSAAKENPADQKWRKRVEQALVKMTAEVAALREQLESRRLFTHTRRYRFFRFLWRIVWGSLKHIAVDVVILGIILLWLRRKKDRRLEGAVRVLLGDAVAEVQRVGGAQLGKVKLPSLGGGKKSSPN